MSRVCFSFPVPQMLAMMVDLEDDDEWAMADELEDDDFDRYSPRMTITKSWLFGPVHSHSFIYLFLSFV